MSTPSPKPVQPIPAGYASAIPYLLCNTAAKAIDFYQQAFGATVVMRMDGPGGVIFHAEMRIGDALFMLADESCLHLKPAFPGAISVYVYVPDVDALAKRAEAAGAKITRPLQTQHYGDRSFGLTDPFGHQWGFASHVEDVSPEEIRRRSAAKYGG